MVTRPSRIGSAPVGKYVLEVGAHAGSFAQFASGHARADKAQARRNAAALRAAFAEPNPPREPHRPLEAVEKLETTADAVTDRVEHAHRLFKAAAEDRLFDGKLLTGEIGALLGLLERLDREGRYEEQIRLAKALHGLCVLAFRWLDLLRSLRTALAAAGATGDEAAQAWALNELGALHLCAGDPKKAEEHLERALELQQRLGDAAGRCATRHNLDSTRRDIARPVQVAAPRRLIALGGVVGALAFFGAGGAALGLTTGGGDGTDPVATVSLTIETRGEGDGSVSGDGIECGTDCEEELARGASMTLTAEAAAGSKFVRWDGVDCEEGSRAETCTLRVDDDLTAVAVFERQAPATRNVEVDIRGDGDGAVVADGIDCGADCEEKLPDGTTLTLTAEPDDGSRFVRWRGVECDEGQRADTCTLRVENDLTAVAVFGRLPRTSRLSVEIGGGGNGSVSADGIACGDDCEEELLAGTTLRLRAQPDDASVFVRWRRVACDEDSRQEVLCTFTIDADVSVVALFEPAVFLRVDVSGLGGVTTDVPGIDCGDGCFKFVRGTSIAISPEPGPGWFFTSWGDEACAGSETDVCFLTIVEDVTVVPVFDEPEP